MKLDPPPVRGVDPAPDPPLHLSGAIGLTAGSVTTAGRKQANEDFIGMRLPDDQALVTKGIVAIVADGVSAARAAREASESAVRGFLADYYETPASWCAKTAGHRVLTSLNRWLCNQGQAHGEAERGCVTTFTSLVFKSQTAHLFHVGDTRAYRLRGNDLELLSRDHTSCLADGNCQLDRALGLNVNLRVDYLSCTVQTGDLYLLTSDGVHGFLKHDRIQGILLDPGRTPQQLAERLDRAAAEAGSDDNRSCLLVRIDSLPDAEPDEVLRRLTQLPFPPDLQPGMVLDRLRVERHLHASSRSQLYLVTDLDSNRSLVMKTPSVNFEDDPDYIEHFALEQWVGQRTSHPNLARILRPPRPPSCLYHLVEFIDGLSLDAWLRGKERSIPEIIAVVRGIIAGTRALHRRETLHQDLKPDNILVDREGTVKIIDYGSARIAGIAEIAAPYQRHSAPGTIDFSAPEYRLGLEPSPRSDLFSIALIAYHLLTGGRHPYHPRWAKARSLRDFTALCYLPAFQHNPLVPPWLDAALQKSLRILPASRHESMSEFLHDLEHPNSSLTPNQPLPLSERNPVLLWKLIALGLSLALLGVLLLD